MVTACPSHYPPLTNTTLSQWRILGGLEALDSALLSCSDLRMDAPAACFRFFANELPSATARGALLGAIVVLEA